MFGLACLCSSLTHALALSSEAYIPLAVLRIFDESTDRFRDIINHYSSGSVSVVHGSQRMELR